MPHRRLLHSVLRVYVQKTGKDGQGWRGGGGGGGGDSTTASENPIRSDLGMKANCAKKGGRGADGQNERGGRAASELSTVNSWQGRQKKGQPMG
jgi:hypothetical protein